MKKTIKEIGIKFKAEKPKGFYERIAQLDECAELIEKIRDLMRDTGANFSVYIDSENIDGAHGETRYT